MHSPEHTGEVAKARRLGGLRRRREVAVIGTYDFAGLANVEDIRRLLEVAALDALALENSIARARTLAYVAVSAIKLLEVREMDERLNRLEAIVLGQKVLAEPIFDTELIGGDFSTDLVDE